MDSPRDSTISEGATTPLRPTGSLRLRGILRHAWINDGLDLILSARPILWSAPIDHANTVRHENGLPLLNPDHDPAPDLIVPLTSSSQPAIAAELAIATVPPQLQEQLASALPQFLQWTAAGRRLIFLLAATSIGCLLMDTVGLITLRSFFFAVLVPACLALVAIAHLNRAKGDGRLFRAMTLGSLAGLVGAAVFFIFRLPFVFSIELGLDRLGIPHLPFFNVYPRIGSLILGEPLQQQSYELHTYFIGWGYHLIRAAATGIMFAAAIGEIQTLVRGSTPRHPFSWQAVVCGALLTVTIQCCLMISPYANLFSTQLTPRFIFILMLAHLSFGMSIGLFYAWYTFRWSGRSSSRSVWAA